LNDRLAYDVLAFSHFGTYFLFFSPLLAALLLLRDLVVHVRVFFMEVLPHRDRLSSFLRFTVVDRFLLVETHCFFFDSICEQRAVGCRCFFMFFVLLNELGPDLLSVIRAKDIMGLFRCLPVSGGLSGRSYGFGILTPPHLSLYFL